MSRLFFYFVIISTVFAAGIYAQGDNRCDENEEYSECGKACELLCPGKPKACPRICVSGCVCREGYARTDRNGICVPVSKCPKSEP